MNLLNVIDLIGKQISELQLEKVREIQKIDQKYDAKIKDLQTALDVNSKLNTACYECEGKGWYSIFDNYNNFKTIDCTCCDGTGVKPEGEINDD